MVWSLQALQPLTDEQFAHWSKLLEARTGIYLREQQRSLLQTQVAMRMRELGLTDYGTYYQTLTQGLSGKVEWSQLLDRLIVKDTRFFRHPASFTFVQNHLRKHLQQAQAPYDLWSLGCATGEEPYSLAIALSEIYHQQGLAPLFGITASDISRAALAHAKTGCYALRKLDTLQPDWLGRYFQPLDDEQVQIVPSLRARVCFNQANLLDISQSPNVPMDIIFCQNVLVYFRKALREKIINALVQRLKPGGALVLGLGEVFDWSHPAMQRAPFDGVQAYLHHSS